MSKGISHFCMMLGTAAISIGILASEASAVTIVSDDFSTGGAGRTVGANLNGTSPQVGSGTWTNPFGEAAHSTQYFEFSDSGTLVRSLDNGAESRIGFSAPEGSILTIRAEMTPINGTGWSGVAFTQDLTSSWYASQTVVAARIQNNQFFMGNASDFGAYSGTMSSFNWDQSYLLELSYNTDTEEARFQIYDGEVVVGDTGWNGSFGGEVGAAAFSIRNPVLENPTQVIEPFVGSFEVTSIPEPDSMAGLLALVVLGVAFGRRRIVSNR
ncbi:MAG: hypothetical protein ACQKBT_12820 [Puniceicoccales bacterium]